MGPEYKLEARISYTHFKFANQSFITFYIVRCASIITSPPRFHRRAYKLTRRNVAMHLMTSDTDNDLLISASYAAPTYAV